MPTLVNIQDKMYYKKGTITHSTMLCVTSYQHHFLPCPKSALFPILHRLLQSDLLVWSAFSPCFLSKLAFLPFPLFCLTWLSTLRSFQNPGCFSSIQPVWLWMLLHHHFTEACKMLPKMKRRKKRRTNREYIYHYHHLSCIAYYYDDDDDYDDTIIHFHSFSTWLNTSS